MELAFKQWEPKINSAQLVGARKLVFLHGMGGTGALWRPIAAFLEDHYRILALDQRGHGGSRIPQQSFDSHDYRPLDFGRDVIETLEATGHHPAWLIGHSMGVRTACAAAHLRPEWVQGLVLIDLGLSGPAGGGMGEYLARFLGNLPLEFPSRAEARAYMNANAPDPSMGQYLMAVAVMDADGRLTFPFDRDALIQTIHATRDTSVRPWVLELAKRGMPILALRGELSRVWSKEDFEAERAHFANFKSVQFKEIAGTGHGLPFDKRKEFLESLQGFIGSSS